MRGLRSNGMGLIRNSPLVGAMREVHRTCTEEAQRSECIYLRSEYRAHPHPKSGDNDAQIQLTLQFVLEPVNKQDKCFLGSHGDLVKFRDQ